MKTKEKILFKVLFIMFMFLILIQINVKADSQSSSDVFTTEDFMNALVDPNVQTINVISDDIYLKYIKPYYAIDITGKTINLNNHTIKTDNMGLIFEGENFIIKNGTFDAHGDSYSIFIGDMEGARNATIENITGNGGFNIFNSNNIVIKNCNVTGTNYYAIWCDQGAQAIVESGTFKTTGVAVIGMSAHEYDTKLEIKGGTFITNEEKPLVLEGKDEDGYDHGRPEISGGHFDIPVDEKYCKDGYQLVEIGENQYEVSCSHKDTTIKNKKESTCSKEGYTGDTYCNNCGKKVSSGSAIALKEHTPSDWIKDEEYHWKVCLKEDCKAVIPESKQKHIEKDGKCEICSYGKPENVVDKNTNIKIEYEEGTIIPENIKLKVDTIKEGTIYNEIKEDLTEVSKFKLFDINLLRDGVKIQPGKKIKINIPIPDDFDKTKLVVYRMEDNSKIEYEVKVITIEDESFAQFETDHFSNYILGEKVAKTTIDDKKPVDEPETNVEHKADDEPKTGMISTILVTTIVLSISVIGLVICKKRMYK